MIGRALRAVLWRADALAGGYSRRRTWYGREKVPPAEGRRGLFIREIAYSFSEWFLFPARKLKLLVLRN